jgi:hypothetical protein
MAFLTMRTNSRAKRGHPLIHQTSVDFQFLSLPIARLISIHGRRQGPRQSRQHSAIGKRENDLFIIPKPKKHAEKWMTDEMFACHKYSLARAHGICVHRPAREIDGLFSEIGRSCTEATDV